MMSPSAKVVEAREADAALVAGGDLAHVVAEAAQRVDAVRGDELAVAVDPCAAADDAAIGDVAAGDDLDLAHAEDLAHFGATLDDLHDLRLEHALEGSLHLLGELVDDVVDADLDALGLRRPARRCPPSAC